MPAANPPAPPPRRVVLVDDNAPARLALGRLLESMGYEVASFGDGTSALDYLRAGPPPDALLVDLVLPDLDGRDVAREVRALAPSTLILLITGWTVNSDPIDLARWGIDRVFPKPVDTVLLLQTFANTFGPP